MCLSPNSDSSERVFSLLTCMFGSERSSSLADQVEAAVMLRYNNNKRNKASSSQCVVCSVCCVLCAARFSISIHGTHIVYSNS